jgi:homoserine kinase type II
MAVYTHLAAEDLAELIAHYPVGELVSAKGIAEGISNSNWYVETSGADNEGGRFILTMYERRIDPCDLPFFLGLLDHLAARGQPVPRTIHDRGGAGWRAVGGKAVALIEFLPGVSVDRPTTRQAQAVGAALAGVHLASADFPGTRENDLRPRDWQALIDSCGEGGLARIDPALASIVARHLPEALDRWPEDLPRTVIHADLFPDNVLMLGNRVGGLIDFYFACRDIAAYDLAVTHAAWCFADGGRRFLPEIAAALVAGYEAVRPLSPAAREALPLLARGASLRFDATRAADWLDTPADALVRRKDPMDFARRLEFYAGAGQTPFTGAP